jgi:hypothetical protein
VYNVLSNLSQDEALMQRILEQNYTMNSWSHSTDIVESVERYLYLCILLILILTYKGHFDVNDTVLISAEKSSTLID